MKLSELGRKKRILIIGFGKEGQATLAFLKSKTPAVSIDTADQQDGPDYLARQGEYDLVIKSPGIPKRLITAPYTTPTNIFFANTRGMIIGITGSKGKSTTASLIWAILKEGGRDAHLVGNIGRPALDALAAEHGQARVYVFELSSYQLDDITYSPHIAVMTNFFPEHMDYHGDVARYWEAKKRIVAHAGADDFFVYNPHYQRIRLLAGETHALAVPFAPTIPFDDRQIPLLGAHNKENVRAAVTVAKILGIQTEVSQRAVAGFHGLPHRLELVGSYHDIMFYDDAISTTPQSTMAAIDAFPRLGAIFLGGQNRGYDFSALAGRVAEKRISVIILFPDSGTAIRQALTRTGYEPDHLLETTDMREAVWFAYQHAPKGSVCLLSTASPSYSVWKNFEEKGFLFQRFVKEYGRT